MPIAHNYLLAKKVKTGLIPRPPGVCENSGGGADRPDRISASWQDTARPAPDIRPGPHCHHRPQQGNKGKKGQDGMAGHFDSFAIKSGQGADRTCPNRNQYKGHGRLINQPFNLKDMIGHNRG